MKFMSLYKGITLTVQWKCTKCTRVYKATFCQRFQSIMNHSILLSLLPTYCTLVLYTLFNSYIKISVLSLVMMFREKKIDPESSNIFSTKQLETWLTHLHGYIISEEYEICTTIQGCYINCIRVLH